MGIFRRRSTSTSGQRPPTPVVPQLSGEPVELTGTTTMGAENLEGLFAAHRLGEGSPLVLAARLVREPANPHDPNTIAVHVQGTRVGYLPGFLAQHAPAVVDQLDCSVRLWSAQPRESGKLGTGHCSPTPKPLTAGTSAG